MTNFKYTITLLLEAFSFGFQFLFFICVILFLFVVAPDLSHNFVITFLDPTEGYDYKFISVLAVQALFVVTFLNTWFLPLIIKLTEYLKTLKKLNRSYYKKLFKKEELVYEYYRYCVEKKEETTIHSFKSFLDTLPDKIEIEK